jgi:DNA-binding YbaB/EbfC family protein
MKKGGFGGGNMQQMMQQAAQMKRKMETIQEELGKKNCEASSGGGVVTAVVNGKQELVTLTIKPEALEGSDAEMLSDLVKAAVNEALKKSQDLSNSAMGGLLGNLPIPPGLF